jgi:hypothetical protein
MTEKDAEFVQTPAVAPRTFTGIGETQMQPRSTFPILSAARRGAIALLALALGTTSLSAQAGQENRAAGRTHVQGRVLDAASGRPLILASVEIPELKRYTTTDTEGRFRFDRVPAGEHGLVVRLVGYREHSRPVSTASDAIEVRMSEDPVLLTGLTVTVNRFDSRMKAVPYAVRVLDKREVANSAANDAAEFVVRRAGLISTRCRSMLQTSCYLIRGSSVEPRVYIDDAHMAGGIDMLANIPREEINRVEVIRSGSVIRVYTDNFMVWAARHNYKPIPLGVN